MNLKPHPSPNPSVGLPTDGLFVDLDVFEGPFDLLVTLILNEDIDLLEVHLAEIVLSYIERLEARGLAPTTIEKNKWSLERLARSASRTASHSA